jgi:cysteine synthase
MSNNTAAPTTWSPFYSALVGGVCGGAVVVAAALAWRRAGQKRPRPREGDGEGGARFPEWAYELVAADDDEGVDRRVWPLQVGNTPLIELACGTEARILAKCEFLNPCGSPKDRVARRIVGEAILRGALRPGDVVVEGTSGSTGISLSLLCAALGLGCRVVMPDDQAEEKVRTLRLAGAAVEEVPSAAISNPRNYVNVARSVASSTPHHYFSDQFEALANFRAHFCGTGREIWAQTGGAIDAFVMAAGTGGLIAGVSRRLRLEWFRAHGTMEGRPEVVLADPSGSSLFFRAAFGVAYDPGQEEASMRRHRYETVVEGVGLDRLTANFRLAAIDSAERISDDEVAHTARLLLRNMGLFVGSSSALNVAAAIRVAQRLGPGKTVVTVLCDSGQRHLSRFWRTPDGSTPAPGRRMPMPTDT